MDIHGGCKYDFEAVRALSHVSLFRNTRPVSRLFFFIICFLIVTFIHFFFVFRLGDDSLRICWFLMIFLICFECYLYFLLPRISYRGMKKLKDGEVFYVFQEDRFSESSVLQGYSGECVVEYKILVKVYETSSYIFLFQTNRQAFILDKASMSPEDALELRNRIRSILGKRYVICKY